MSHLTHIISTLLTAVKINFRTDIQQLSTRYGRRRSRLAEVSEPSTPHRYGGWLRRQTTPDRVLNSMAKGYDRRMSTSPVHTRCLHWQASKHEKACRSLFDAACCFRPDDMVARFRIVWAHSQRQQQQHPTMNFTTRTLMLTPIDLTGSFGEAEVHARFVPVVPFGRLA
ncbi:hypothetical protein CDEST_14825 [Colletotrichum destructivum]|uniref:Uncharacterized protein n=1 Tax=Colletotrichum destructivum TaxID=34406 RepID=A0AAX4J347_9PEZI|nr:hypothetical protein CDEST_14825 [Colletotrichum destructivum]